VCWLDVGIALLGQGSILGSSWPMGACRDHHVFGSRAGQVR
jgi:hypothetical protein